MYVFYVNVYTLVYVRRILAMYVYNKLASRKLQCFVYVYSNQTVGGWSSEGIKQSSNPGLPVLCNTTHLTSFAVLVSTAETKVCTAVVMYM